MDNKFLHKKRIIKVEECQKEEKEQNKIRKINDNPENMINFPQIIEEAFNNFLNGENDKFLKNYELLEKNKSTKMNLKLK